MDIITITQSLSSGGLRSRKNDDLWTDRLCYHYSVIILTVFAVMITTKAYVGDPIDCWAPPEFKSSYEKYAETLCFVNGTYHISANELDIPIDPKSRYSNRIRYYQWTPFILLLQAFFMYIPRILWISFNKRNGINLFSLVDAAIKYESLDSYSEKEKILVYLCKNLLRSIQFNEYNIERKMPRDKEDYKKCRIELSKLLKMQPEVSAENSKLYNENLLKIISATKNKNPRKKIEILNLKNEVNNELKKLPKHQSTPKDNSEEIEPKKSTKSPHTSRSQSKNNRILHKTPKNDSNSINDKFLGNFESESTDLTNEYQQNLNQIHTKISSISKKHIFNILSTDYEINTKSDSNLRRNSRKEPEKLKQSFSFSGICPDFSTNYLSVLYVVIKIIYLLSLIGQFFFLNRLIGNEFYLLGINLIKSFLFEREWPHMTIFPRVTLCEIYIREIGTIHPYLIQCVLRINLFNEIIFILVWFWLAFLIVVLFIDFLFRFVWVLLACTNCQRKLFALKYLELIHMNSTHLKHEPAKNIFNQEISNDLSSILKKTNQSHYANQYSYKQQFVNNKFPTDKKSSNDSSAYYDNNFSANQIETDATHYDADPTPFNNEHTNSPFKEINILVKISQEEELAIFEKFCDNSFSNDTIFALRVIQQNASNIIVSEIIEYMWLQFKSLNFIVSNDEEDFIFKKLVVLNSDDKKHVKKRVKQPGGQSLIEMHDYIEKTADNNQPEKVRRKK